MHTTVALGFGIVPDLFVDCWRYRSGNLFLLAASLALAPVATLTGITLFQNSNVQYNGNRYEQKAQPGSASNELIPRAT